MVKANLKIRNALKDKGIFQWQLAEQLNIGEYTLTKRLRSELPKEQQESIVQIIEKMAKEVNG